MRIDNLLNLKKNSALIAAVAGVTAAGVGLTCGINAYAEEEDPNEFDVVQTEETAESEADETVIEETGAEISEDAAEEIPEETAAPAVSGDLAASQALYMTPRTDIMDFDYSPYAYDDYCIEDMSVIADEELRAIAQSYYDQGFFIDNPEITLGEGMAPGDSDMMFANGFAAHSGAPCDSYVYWDLQVYKMDETLFNYYFMDLNYMNPYVWDGEYDEITDDGTVIRAVDHFDNFDFAVEFDRSTGIAMISDIKVSYSEEDFYVTPGPITDDLSVITNDDLRAIAEDLAAEGYTIWEDGFFYGLGDSSSIEGFQAVWQDGSTCITMEVTTMNDEIFDEIFGDPEIYTITDNGTEAVVTYAFDGADDSEQYVYNRDTGIMVWSFEFDY